MLKGFYFINTNIFNKKAHSLQISKTIEAVNNAGKINLTLAAPLYVKKPDINCFFDYCGVKNKFEVRLLYNFGLRRGTILSFITFNFSSVIYLFYIKFFKKADFIYFRSEYFLFIAVFAKILRLRYYYEIHRKGLSKKEDGIKNFLVKSAAGVVALTEGLKSHYEKFNPNIVSAHDSVDLERFDININKEEARKKLDMETVKKIFMYCGSMRKGKGIETILEAAKEFPEQIFYLVGRVDPQFGAIVDKYKSANIVFAGEVPNSIVPIYLKAADMLILPHLSNLRSQGPMKLFEYMASGGVILSSDLENIREVLFGNDALFFKAGDSLDFSLKIKEFLADPQSYAPMGENVRVKAKEYTWEKRGEKISNLMTKNEKF